MNHEGFERRGVVEVAGPDARSLLQRLITNDVDDLAPNEARYAALLSPHGKILVDFLVVPVPTPEMPERFLLDCPALLAADLAKKLALYRLRAKVTVTDRSADLAAAPVGDALAASAAGLTVDLDPRQAALGERGVGPRSVVERFAAESAGYREHETQATRNFNANVGYRLSETVETRF